MDVQIAEVRQHPFFLVPSLTAAFGGLFAAVVVSVVSGASTTPGLIGWVLAAVLIGRVAFAIMNWSVRRIVLTNNRLILFSGLLNPRTKVFPYAALMEMSFSRSFAGRVLRFGTFTVEAGGRPVMIMNYIPYSEQLMLLLSGRLFPSADDSESDLERDGVDFDSL
jgi:uncharacterized membrane protein YdbT with pleckstrin-like domain